MTASRTLDRERRLLAGVCAYSSGCGELAVEGSAYCAPHDAHERARGAARKRRQRGRLAAAKRCVDCGKRTPVLRCTGCRRLQRERRVTGNERRVTGKIHHDLAAGIMLALSQLAQMRARGIADLVPAQCGHAVCAVPAGEQAFCLFAAIASARTQRQADGSPPDERGSKLPGVEYVLTIERIAMLMGVSTRSVEIWIARALRALRSLPEAKALLENIRVSG